MSDHDLDVLFSSWSDSWTPLHFAAYENDSDRALTHCTPEYVNKHDKAGRTPLQIALENQSVDVIAILVRNGALIEDVDIRGSNGLDLFEDQYYFKLGVKLLPVTAMNRSFLVKAACHACYTNRPDILTAVINNDSFHSTDVLCKYDITGHTALYYAVLGHSTQCVEMICDMLGPLDSARLTSMADLTHPIHHACTQGHSDIFNLLYHSLSPSWSQILTAQDVRGRTPFHCALYNHHWDLIASNTTLLHTVDPNIVDSEGHSIQGLLYLKRTQNLIPCQYQASIPCLTSDEACFMLHSVISDGGDPNLLQHSLSYISDPDVFDLMDQSPLIHAAKLGQSETCSLLIEHGADQSLRDFGNKTALHYAAANGHADTVRLLVSSTQPIEDWLAPSKDLNTPLDLALLGGHFEIVDIMLQALTTDMIVPNWIKTLSLAVSSYPSITTLHELSNHFPRNWIEELLLTNDGGNSTKKSSGQKPVPDKGRRPFLKRYVPYPSSVQTHRVFIRNQQNVDKVRKMQNQQLVDVKKHKMFVKISNESRHKKNSQLAFQKYRHELYYPIHQAIIARNKEAFEFFFDESLKSSLLQELLSFTGLKGLSVGQLLSEYLPELIEDHGIGEKVYEHLMNVFDGEMPFDLAMLHFIVSEIPSLIYKKRVSYSLLYKWPDWFLRTHLNKYLALRANNDMQLEDMQLDDIDQVIPLVKILMKSNSLVNPSILASVLYAAVSNGLRPELFKVILSESDRIDHSLAVTSNESFYFRKWPLLEAIKLGYYDLASLLLQYGDLVPPFIDGEEYTNKDKAMPSYLIENFNHIGDHTYSVKRFSFKQKLLSSLDHIISVREFQFALNLLSLLPPEWLTEYLVSHQSKRLLHVCMLHDEGAELGEYLINNYMSIVTNIVCTEVNVLYEESTGNSEIENKWGNRSMDSFSCLSTIIDVALKHSGSASWCRESNNLDSIQLLSSFVVFCTNIQASQYFRIFDSICGRGHYQFLKLVLECDQFRSETLVAPNSKGFTPLYQLAAGGHLQCLQLVLSYFPSIISTQGRGVVHTSYLGALFHLCYVNHIQHPKYFKNVLKHLSNLLLPQNLRVDTKLDQTSVEELLKICFNLSDYSLHKKSIDLLTILLLHVPDLLSLVHTIEDFVTQLRMVYEGVVSGEWGVASGSKVYSMPKDIDDDDVSEWFLKDTSDERQSEWYHGMYWYKFAYQNISDWIIADSASFNHPHICSDNRILQLLESFLNVYPPFNPLVLVQKGYTKLLKDCASSINQVASHDNHVTILDSWHQAIIDITRTGDGEAGLGILKQIEQSCAQFHSVYVFEPPRKLMMATVGCTGDEGQFCIELFEYLLKFEEVNDCFVPVAEYAAKKGNIEAIQSLVSHYRLGIESNFTSILKAAAKSSQLDMINYFYKNQFAVHVRSRLSDYFSDDVKFWLVVFQAAVRAGKQDLALTALNQVPFNALLSMSTSVNVIHDACWWGMVEILSTLCIEDTKVFFKPNSNGCSPFQAALDSGNIGRISTEVDSFQLCTHEFDFFTSEFFQPIRDSLPEVDILSRFSFGWSRKALGSTANPSPGLEYFNTQYVSILPNKVIHNLPNNMVTFIKSLMTPNCSNIVNSYLQTSGIEISGVLLKYLLDQHSVNVLHLAVYGGDFDAVMAILESLSQSDVLHSFTTLDVFRTALIKNNSRVVEVLTKFCDSDVLANLRSPKSGETILHIVAEYSQSGDCASLMLSMLISHIQTLVHTVDNANMSPIECAVVLGKWFVAQSLLQSTGSVSSEVSKLLLRCHGWFSCLMQKNKEHACTESSVCTMMPSSMFLSMLPSIRHKSVLEYYDIFKNVHRGIAESCMSVSCGILSLYAVNEDDESKQQCSWSRLKLIDFFEVNAECLKWCRRNQYKSVMNIVNYAIHANEIDVLEPSIIDQVFTMACLQGSLPFIEYTFAELYPGVISEKAVIEGFVNASGMGQLEVMGHIMLHSGVSHRVLKNSVKDCRSLKMCSLLFFTPASEIFNTLKSVDTTNIYGNRSSRVLMSQIWLMHRWDQYQLELVNKQISRTFTYPQLLEVNNTLTVELSSFPDTFDGAICPFAKLAVVQSACVSHFVPIQGDMPTFVTQANSADIVLTCNTEPSTDHYIQSSYDGNITVWYDSRTGLFSLPFTDSGSTEDDDRPVTSDTTLSTIPHQDTINMSLKSCLTRIKDIKVPLSVNTDHLILDTADSITDLSRALVTCMLDLLAVLRLHQHNYLFALYTELGLIPKDFFQCYRQYNRCLPTKSSLKELMSKISVNFATGYESQVICSKKDSSQVLNVSFTIGRSTDGYGFDTPTANETTQVIGAELVRCEISRFSSRLSSYLVTLPTPVSVHCYNEDYSITDIATKPSEIPLQAILILRFLPLIKTFIKITIATLYSCLEPGVTMATVFSGNSGIKMLLRADTHPSVFDTTQGHFSISIYDILPHVRKQVLANLVPEFIQSSSIQGLSLYNRPVAITSYIDLNKSMDLLMSGPQSELEGTAVIRNLNGDEVEVVKLTREELKDSLFELSAKVGGVHVLNSPLVYDGKAKVKDPFNTNGSMYLFVSHPNGGCTPIGHSGRRPHRLLMSSKYQSIREKIGVPRLNKARSSIKCQVQCHGLLYGHEAQVVRVHPGNINVYLSSEAHFSPYSIRRQSRCVRMSHGVFQVIIGCSRHFTVDDVVAVSCAKCGCAMKIHTCNGSLYSGKSFTM